jgi:hypothetical protein
MGRGIEPSCFLQSRTAQQKALIWLRIDLDQNRQPINAQERLNLRTLSWQSCM